MTRETLQRIRDGEVLRVRVDPRSIGPGALPRHLRGDLLAVSVTDAGFVQCQYEGRNYGPTLHYESLRLAPPWPTTDEVKRIIREHGHD